MMTVFDGTTRATIAALLCATLTACSDDTGTTTTLGQTTTSPGSTTTVSTTGEPTTGEPTTTTVSGTSTVGMTGSTGDGTTGTTSTSTDSTGPVASTGPATTGPACDAPAELCGDVCVDTQSDALHCGGCDQPCGMGFDCVAGDCTLPCPMGQEACGDTCVDTQTDPLHCGGCDQPCAMGELCMTGNCALDCMDGFEACGMSCIDTQVDEQHCGGCDQPCGDCEQCNGGSCALPPAPPAPGPIEGMTQACAGASIDLSIPMVMNATKYTWTVPDGATITGGQDTEKITVKLGNAGGQACVSFTDGCVESAQACVDITVTGGMPGSKTFAYTGGAQEFDVPACVTKLTVELWAAQGGGSQCCNGSQDDGGLGGYVKADLTVMPMDKLFVYVGQKGTVGGAGGWNGGGASGQYGGSGGGASDVRIGGQQLNNRVLVAGAGGGGNCGCPEHGAGGAGGGLIGDPGISQGGWGVAGGGTQNAGGNPGSNPGVAGQLGLGGGPAAYHVGGGGGGYYGGGGAYAAGGGGGSSFYGNAMNASTMKGIRAGNGEIKISW